MRASSDSALYEGDGPGKGGHRFYQGGSTNPWENLWVFFTQTMDSMDFRVFSVILQRHGSKVEV